MNRFACLSLVPLTAAPTVSAAALNPAMDDENFGRERRRRWQSRRSSHRGRTLLRIYPDETTKEIVYKTGDVKWLDESNGSTTAYSLKNIGKTEVVLFTVVLK